MSDLRARMKELLGPRWTTTLRCLYHGHPLPRWGNLRRTRPFSSTFGFERGLPIDRHYLHRFLSQERAAIRGDVLEIQAPEYTRRFGRAISAAHSVDINADHRPTYLCDLARAEGVIASDRYDCFLLPNTLIALRDLDGCLRQALRVVRPGGTILASGSALVPLMPDAPDYWRLSPDGWREVTSRVWPDCDVEVRGHGNCLAATAALLGLAVEELRPAELDLDDPRYPVLVTVRCRRR